MTTRQESYTGFTGVQAGSGFTFTVTQSDSYSVMVTTDDNVMCKQLEDLFKRLADNAIKARYAALGISPSQN